VGKAFSVVTKLLSTGRMITKWILGVKKNE